MNEMRLLFDQPSYELSLNGRLTWRQKAGMVRKVRTTAKLLTLAEVRAYPEFEGFEPNVYDITWFFSYGVEPDEDNIVGRCKSLLDGMADALKVNDRGWHLGIIRRIRVRAKNPLRGRMEITLRSE